MNLSIIIVNYNTEKLTLKCLQSLYRSNDELKWETIVVDNGSKDDSLQNLKTKFPDIKIIESPTNLGFGTANNLGATGATGDYLLFLNSDCEVYPDTLQTWFDLVIGHQSAISSCKLVNPDGSIQPQGGALPNLNNVFDWMFFFDDLPLINSLILPYQQRHRPYFFKDHQPGWLSGTALLVKRSVFDTLDGFDETIFMYGEDVEFCYRAKKEGFHLDYYCKPQIRHLGQGSGSSANALLGEFQGLIYLWKKHKPGWQLPLLKLNLIFGALFRIVIFGMIRGDGEKRATYIKALTLVG